METDWSEKVWGVDATVDGQEDGGGDRCRVTWKTQTRTWRVSACLTQRSGEVEGCGELCKNEEGYRRTGKNGKGRNDAEGCQKLGGSLRR